jgi:hypothetical protein
MKCIIKYEKDTKSLNKYVIKVELMTGEIFFSLSLGIPHNKCYAFQRIVMHGKTYASEIIDSDWIPMILYRLTSGVKSDHVVKDEKKGG